jgi:hypothetical protein
MSCMRKVIWITLLSIVVITAGTLTTLRFAPAGDSCERLDRVLAKSDQGRSAVYSLEICTNIGTRVNASVDVVSSSGRHQTALRFLPVYGLVKWRAGEVTGPAEPSAAWISPRSLRISIGTVGTVLEQRPDMGDVQVTYDIRKDLHMEKAEYGDW